MSDILDKVIATKEENEKRSISFVEIVNSLLALVKAREAEILRLRYGLFNDKKHTLEEIGKKMNLTRERIRQLERIATQNIRAHKDFGNIIEPAKQAVNLTIKEHGGLASKKKLARVMQIDDEIEASQRILEFLVDNFVDDIKPVKHDLFLDGWYIHQDYLELAADVIRHLYSLIETRQKLIHEDELLKNFKGSDFYNTNKERFGNMINSDDDLKKVLDSYLDLSKGLGNTPFKQWGRADWRNVKPKRINDKIYLVLDWYGKPMHFKEIADKINEAKFDHKIAHPATIHNDLIADPRFVLIGRGVYALKEWGYKSGVVSDIIEQILKEKGEPMTKDDITAAVLGQRDVKSNTVALALNKNNRFEKQSDGKYTLKKNL